jgi:translation initiation factor 1
MAKKNTSGAGGGMVYSTGNSGSSNDRSQASQKAVPASDQLLYVSIDRKQRRGKEVTLIEGFQGPDLALAEMAKTLKSKCGTGGSAKDGQIIIQGNFRDKIILMLEGEGYKVKRKGG